jgi:hypothetical protein
MFGNRGVGKRGRTAVVVRAYIDMSSRDAPDRSRTPKTYQAYAMARRLQPINGRHTRNNTHRYCHTREGIGQTLQAEEQAASGFIQRLMR